MRNRERYISQNPTQIKMKNSLFAIIVLLASVCFISAQHSGADLILVNGKIRLMDEKNSLVNAVAVKGTSIVAVGTDAEIRRLAGSNTRVVDLKGKAVI